MTCIKLNNWYRYQNIYYHYIKEYWDFFVKVGAARPILGYEFGIDTGDAKPVFCKKPSYEPYESKVIVTQVDQLLNNKWIRRCGGHLRSMVVLAQNPHQEHINAIEDFVWRMCVSYRRLKAVTKPFQFPIPRCDDAITILGCGAVTIYIINLDARQRYHQVAVRVSDQERLAFYPWWSKILLYRNAIWAYKCTRFLYGYDEGF